MTENLPVLILSKHVLLPYQELKLDLTLDRSKNVVNLSYEDYNKKILVIFKDGEVNESNLNELSTVGVIAKISRKMLLSNNNLRVVLSGLNRVKFKIYC